ncbi:HpcH/HpaI aldolase/citrate lyase family protein [Enterovirga sp. CN4-39]|uniref:HpcH/HpaI aldolase/citrate lyase family protein n=1 Tax=Enterovirga sp. CN4-39 TaxID=3400910 RepID=UPI003BFC5026
MNVHRSLLFTPADSERKVEKAFLSAADGVILDLEDAVAVSAKPLARERAAEIVAEPRRLPAYVRVNGTTTPFCFRDVMAVTRPGLSGILLPKVESAAQLLTIDWVMTQIEEELGLPRNGCEIMPLIETAGGLTALDEIARATPRVRRLAFGAVDLAFDMDIDIEDDRGAMEQARFAVARASRAAGLTAPFDTAFPGISEPERLRATARHAKALGYSGKSCIHPSQVEIVNEVFSPSATELDRSRRIVAAFDEAEAKGSAAIMLDGQMIDYPIVDKARRLLASGLFGSVEGGS